MNNSAPAEAALIAALLRATVPANREDLLANLRSDYFSDERCRHVYEMVSSAVRDGRQIDAITAAEASPSIGGWLVQICKEPTSQEHLGSYVEAVRENYKLRELGELGRQITTWVAVKKKPAEIVGNINSVVAGVETSIGFQSMADAKTSFGAAIVRATAGQNDANRIRTGYADLDKMIGGWQPGRLHVVAARPGVGKSSFVFGAAMDVAAQNRVVVTFSLEMPTSEVSLRLLCRDANVAFHKANAGGLDLVEIGLLKKSQLKLEQLSFHVDDTPGIDVDTLLARTRRIFSMNGQNQRGMLLVDYLQLMKTGDASNHDLELGKITGALKTAAKSLGVPVILVSQLNREVEKRESKRPQLSDLRGSGSIEQDADLVMFVHRPDYYQSNSTGSSELVIAKNRGGPVGAIKTKWNASTMSFTPF